MNDERKWLAYSLLSVVGVIATFATGYWIAYAIMSVAPQETEARVHATVKMVCDYSRDRVNGELEEACGRAQDVSRTTYKCPLKDDGKVDYTAPTYECWVEEQ